MERRQPTSPSKATDALDLATRAVQVSTQPSETLQQELFIHVSNALRRAKQQLHAKDKELHTAHVELANAQRVLNNVLLQAR